MKQCKSCGAVKEFEDFGKHKRNRDGFRNECKPCAAKIAMEYREKNRALLAEKARKYHSENREAIAKRSKEYYINNKDSLLAVNKRWRDLNKTRMREASQRWANANREKVRESGRKWRERNKTKSRQNTRDWQKRNPDKTAAALRRRKLAKIRRSPKWLTQKDLEKMKDMYALAIGLTVITGQKYHVDHVVPLRGELVCGLHVPENLQVLPADENLKKGNSWDVDTDVT